MNIGLKIDVDTLRGTREGVLPLSRFLAEQGIKATFFFSVGPDNMGRNVWRLIRPEFLRKMFRSKASSLYGWDILLRGTFWPGPLIGERCREIIRETSQVGHEIGLHAWDHYAWQVKSENAGREWIQGQLQRGVETLTAIIGKPPVASAAPAWKCNECVLEIKEAFPFVFNSDCRGGSVFRPMVNGNVLRQTQVPTTLPTYDELIGTHGVDLENYNETILSLIKPDHLNVLTIHAEVEGIACFDMFRTFVHTAKQRNINFISLKSIVEQNQNISEGIITQKTLEGREGTVAFQT